MEYDYYLDLGTDGLIIDKHDKNVITEGSKKRTAELFIRIRSQTGMNRKEFAEWLGIPYRTMQDWERGVSQLPDYLLRLIAYKVMMEDKIQKGDIIHVDPKNNRKDNM